MISETTKIVDIPPEILEEAEKRITDYTVGFVKLNSLNRLDATLGGSGTLVKTDKCHAILTAAHVVDKLWKDETFGLILARHPSGQLHNLTLNRDWMTEPVQLERPSGLDKTEPPDIALVILPEAMLDSVTALKSFYNISQPPRDSLTTASGEHLGFWAISGFAGEWTDNRRLARGFERVLVFNGKIMWGFPTILPTNTDFDAWEFAVERDRDYDGPESFGGYSGGGLWQNLLKTTREGGLTLTKSILSGVAFYQSGFQENSNIIRANGRDCIYHSIVKALNARLHGGV